MLAVHIKCNKITACTENAHFHLSHLLNLFYELHTCMIQKLFGLHEPKLIQNSKIPRFNWIAIPVDEEKF